MCVVYWMWIIQEAFATYMFLKYFFLCALYTYNTSVTVLVSWTVLQCESMYMQFYMNIDNDPLSSTKIWNCNDHVAHRVSFSHCSRWSWMRITQGARDYWNAHRVWKHFIMWRKRKVCVYVDKSCAISYRHDNTDINFYVKKKKNHIAIINDIPPRCIYVP